MIDLTSPKEDIKYRQGIDTSATSKKAELWEVPIYSGSESEPDIAVLVNFICDEKGQQDILSSPSLLMASDMPMSQSLYKENDMPCSKLTEHKLIR